MHLTRPERNLNGVYVKRRKHFVHNISKCRQGGILLHSKGQVNDTSSGICGLHCNINPIQSWFSTGLLHENLKFFPQKTENFDDV